MRILIVFGVLCLVPAAYTTAVPQMFDSEIITPHILDGQDIGNSIQLWVPIQSGKAAYNFKLTALDGKTINLAHFKKQNIVVLSVSTLYTDDPLYFANLERIYRDYRDAEVIVLSVIAKQQSGELSSFGQSFAISYPILPDPKNSVAELYEITSFPTIAIIDKSGVTRYLGRRLTHWTFLEEQIELIIAREEGNSPKHSDFATVESATKSLRSFNRHLRCQAVRTMGELGGGHVVPALITALNDRDRCVRWHAIQALGKIKDIRAIAPLSDALKSKDGGIRELAAQALGQIGNKAAMEPLIKALNDDSELVLLAVIKALENMKDERVASQLIPFLRNDILRESTVEALIKQDELAVSPLMDTLEGDNRAARTTAAYTLGKIAQRIGPQLVVEALEQEARITRLRKIARADTARLYVLLGRAYRERGMYDDAVESYKTSLATLSGREYFIKPKAVANRAKLHPENRDSKEASSETAVRPPGTVQTEKAAMPTRSETSTSASTSLPSQPIKDATGPAVGNIAPDFSLLDLNGERVYLSDFRGKTIILYFWALWSGDNAHQSMRQIQSFNELYRDYQKQDVEVMGISIDEKDMEIVKSYKDTYDVNFPIFIGDKNITQLYKIQNMPAIFFIDHSGKIRKHYTGYKSKYVYDIDIKGILAK